MYDVPNQNDDNRFNIRKGKPPLSHKDNSKLFSLFLHIWMLAVLKTSFLYQIRCSEFNSNCYKTYICRAKISQLFLSVYSANSCN